MATGSSVDLACFIIIFLECLMGIFTNIFIISILSLNCCKYRKPKSGSDNIILALSISNVCYTCIVFSTLLIFYYWPLIIVTHNLGVPIFVANTSIFITSLWLTASLCFFYYVKIKSFTSDFLSRLKMKISSLVPWMIFMSLALSCFSGSLNIVQFVLDNELFPSTSNVHPINISFSHRSSTGVFSSNLYIMFGCSLIPFMISVVTTASTAYSLNLHRLKMTKNKTPSSSNVRVNTYEDTIRVMIYLLIFYAIIFVVLLLFYFNIFAAYSIGFWVFLVIMCSYGLSQSIILSLATTKLKKAWLKVFRLGIESGVKDESRGE